MMLLNCMCLRQLVGLVVQEHGCLFGLDTWSVFLNSVSPSSNVYAIGNCFDSEQDCGFGTIADFRLYSTERSWSDIQREMNSAVEKGLDVHFYLLQFYIIF